LQYRPTVFEHQDKKKLFARASIEKKHFSQMKTLNLL